MRSSDLVRSWNSTRNAVVEHRPRLFLLLSPYIRHDVFLASDMTCIPSLHEPHRGLLSPSPRRGRPPGSKETEQFACQVENQRKSPGIGLFNTA
jgi:hypothetical protein